MARQNNQSRALQKLYKGMKNRSIVNPSHFLLAILLLMRFASMAQSNQWTTSVTVGGTPQLAD